MNGTVFVKLKSGVILETENWQIIQNGAWIVIHNDTTTTWVPATSIDYVDKVAT